MDDFQQARSSLEGERRRKRVITDARREQNRAASRAYRQRQRQASEALQLSARGCSRRYHELRPRHLSVTEESTSTLCGRAGVPPLSAQLQDNTCINPCPDSTASQPVSLETNGSSGGTIQHMFSQGRDVYQDVYLSLSETTAALDLGIDDCQVGKYPAFDSTVSSLPITNLDEHGSATSGMTIPSTSSLISPSEDYMFLVASHLFSPEANLAYPAPRGVTSERETKENLMSISFLPSIPKQVSAFYSPKSKSQPSSQTLDYYHGQGLSTNEFGYKGFEPESFSHTELDNVLEGQGQTQHNSMYLAMPSLLPGFYKPYSRQSKLSPSIAYMHVAILLGITLHDLANGKPCSPFYRQTTAEDDPKALLAAAAIPSLPAHLQPTLPQILFPHKPNLDLLPFPLLRARAITLTATNPQLVNPEELKMDILRDGLICWNSRSDDNNGTRQPWDIHSWEAAPWFKKKWSMLFDEENNHELC